MSTNRLPPMPEPDEASYGFDVALIKNDSYSTELMHAYGLQCFEAGRPQRQPIETAPVGKEMFVARTIGIRNRFTGGHLYTSDPWIVWQYMPGEFARWPHNFAPTHWMPLPEPPKA